MDTEYGNSTMPNLRKAFFQAVSDNNYSKSYQYYFELRFKTLEEFMIRHGIERYTPEVGNSFVETFTRERNLQHSTELQLKCFIFKLNDIFHGVGFRAIHNNISHPRIIYLWVI